MVIAKINKTYIITDVEDIFYIGNPKFKEVQEYLESIGFEKVCNHTFTKDNKRISFGCELHLSYVTVSDLPKESNKDFNSLLLYCLGTDEEHLLKSYFRRAKNEIKKFLANENI